MLGRVGPVQFEDFALRAAILDECQIYLEGVGRWTVLTPINPDARSLGTNETKMAARNVVSNVVCVRVTQSQSILTTDGLQKKHGTVLGLSNPCLA